MRSWNVDARHVRRGLGLIVALFVAVYLMRSLVEREHDTRVTTNMNINATTESPEERAEKQRCKHVRKQVATSLATFVNSIVPFDENFKELVKPLFPEKHLVIWSSQANAGPLLELRSLLEPLGVDFIEHTVQHNCRQLCDCHAPSPAIEAAAAGLVRPNDRLGDDTVAAFRTALANLSSFSRIDAFFSAYP